MEDMMALPLKRQITKAVDHPDLMEATTETRNGFIRIAVSQDDASYLEAVLKTRTVHFPLLLNCSEQGLLKVVIPRLLHVLL